MFRKLFLTLFVLAAILASTACDNKQTHQKTPANMANPASVYCEQQGGKLKIEQDASGGSVGMCTLPDGSECEEWAYYRGECKPGDAPPADKPAATLELASDGWQVYRNETFGYSFHYPLDATISSAGDQRRR